MKSIVSVYSNRLFRLGLLILAAWCWAAPTARAGLTFTVDLYVSGGTCIFYTPMNTNGISAAAPLGIYTISSPGQPGQTASVLHLQAAVNPAGQLNYK